jgi:uncharacterized protein
MRENEASVSKQGLRYEQMMEQALCGVMREALLYVQERGLPGQHHFYITFRTEHPGVEIPESLRQKFPREMTIVLQYQFWGLKVGEDGFEVTLSFDAKPERLVVPFLAVSAFVDPSAQFGLQFTGGESPEAARPQAAPAASVPVPPTDPKPDPTPGGDGDRVVKLDSFRKK